jgi:hypothetical protein
MKRHAQLAVLTSLLLFVASAVATTAPPAQKVVFVGDQVTSLWPLTQTNPNWINLGQVNARAGELPLQQAINLHPNNIHIMVGEVDESYGDMGMEPVLAIPSFFGALQGMVDEVRAANIQVILGMEPQINGLPLNEVISAYGAQQGIPVISYNVPTTLNNGYIGNQIPTAAGYQQMTALLENVLPTVGLQLGGGYLQNTAQNTGGAPIFTNVNSVNPFTAVSFTAVGWFNNNPALQQQINTNLQGANGTWTSSNPLVMTISQQGGAQALTYGTTIIRYTSFNGVQFSEWVMNVVPYGE